MERLQRRTKKTLSCLNHFQGTAETSSRVVYIYKNDVIHYFLHSGTFQLQPQLFIHQIKVKLHLENLYGGRELPIKSLHIFAE